MLKYYAVDPEYINLNNGSHGTTPKPVQLAIDDLTAKMESCPHLFHKISYLPMLVDAREKVASLIGAKTDKVVFVQNASMGINIILRNFEWEEGEIIISFSTTYNAISRTLQHISDIPPHPISSVINVAFPTTHKEIVKQLKAHLRKNTGRPNGKRVVVDSIIYNPGVLLPWKEMVKICKEEGAWSVVDAAHSLGQEVGLDLTQSAPDFWISNCHKWLSAKRSCAVLYVPERNQHIVNAAIPTSALYSNPSGPGIHHGFAKQFEWTGTIDWARILTIPDALEFRQWMGGEKKINEYFHDLALKGGRLLAKMFGINVIDPDGELTLNMSDKQDVGAFFYHNAKWWIRFSAQAQVLNDLEDFGKIGKLWLEAYEEVKEEFGLTENPK